MSRGSTPRHAQTAGALGFVVQFNAETETWHFALSANYMIFFKSYLYILTLFLEKVGDTYLFSRYRPSISIWSLLYT